MSRTLETILLLVAGGLATPVYARPAVLSAGETIDVPLVVASLSKVQGAVSVRELGDAVVLSLAADNPDVSVRRVVDGDIDACRLDVNCLAETRAILTPPRQSESGLVVVVETSPVATALTLVARVYDLEAIALKRSHGESSESIQASTLRCEGPETTVADVGSLGPAVVGALAPCSAILRARLEPLARARLVVHGVPPSSVISLDGRTLGLVGSSSVVVVSSVRPGPRQLEIRAERSVPYQAEINVAAPQTDVEVHVERESRAPVMLVTGAFATAAGAAVLAIAATAESDFVRFCPSGPCSVPDGGWVQSGGVDPISGPSGVPVAPVGIAVLAAGLVWGVSDLVFAEDGFPGFTILAGLAAAGIGAAVSVGAN